MRFSDELARISSGVWHVTDFAHLASIARHGLLAEPPHCRRPGSLVREVLHGVSVFDIEHADPLAVRVFAAQFKPHCPEWPRTLWLEIDVGALDYWPPPLLTDYAIRHHAAQLCRRELFVDGVEGAILGNVPFAAIRACWSIGPRTPAQKISLHSLPSGRSSILGRA
jgi:hypothetical protein